MNITETYAFILPQFTSGKDKGQCNEGNNTLSRLASMGRS